MANNKFGGGDPRGKGQEARAAVEAALAAGGTETAAEEARASRYKAAELARSARARFGVPPEAAAAALGAAGKKEATVEETQRIVADFMRREVK